MQNYSMRVLMVHTNPCIRVFKEVNALRKKGIKVDLLCQDVTLVPDLKQQVDSIYKWTTVDTLKDFLTRHASKWDIIHCHNEPNDFIAVTIACCSDRPVIYDCHDFTSERTPNLDAVSLATEQICFTQSAAVVHVSQGMKDLAFKKYGPSLSIVLPSLPSRTDIRFQPKPKLQEGIHIVYQGGIVGKNSERYSYRYYLPFFQALCQAGLHMHVFPPRNAKWTFFPEYLHLAAQTPYLHLYQSLPYLELLETISQCQWGLSGFNFDAIPSEGRPFLDNALPNKLFDYLYAGVCPVVINNATSAAFVEKHKIGYRAKDIQEFVDICKNKQPLPPLTDYSVIDMDQQIEKLIQLYKACMDARSISIGKIFQPTGSPVPTPEESHAMPMLTVHSEKACASLREMLLGYYTSGIWLYKETNIYFSHTSADSHAFYLMALCALYRKAHNEETLLRITSIAELLLRLNNAHEGGCPGWGLGATYSNKVAPKPGGVIPATATYTYTSSVVARALLAAYDITQDKRYLEQCTTWKESFWTHIGLHPENGCCRYGDHESYMDVSSFVPNATPLFMGFLADYIKFTNQKEDKPVLAKMCRDFMKLERHGNWTYRTGQKEDLLHLSMIAEGLHMTNAVLGPIADTSSVIKNILRIMFTEDTVNLDSTCLGTANWGPGWALSVLLQYGVPEKYIHSGITFLKNNLSLLLYNIRTASIYMRFLAELEEKGLSDC